MDRNALSQVCSECVHRVNEQWRCWNKQKGAVHSTNRQRGAVCLQKREAEDGVSGLHLSFTTETEHVLSISAFSLPSPFTLTDKNTHLSHVSANCTNISRRRPESPFVCLCWSGRCSCSLKDSCFPWQPCHFLFNDLALASGESRGSWSHSSLKVECVCVSFVGSLGDSCTQSSFLFLDSMAPCYIAGSWHSCSIHIWFLHWNFSGLQICQNIPIKKSAGVTKTEEEYCFW